MLECEVAAAYEVVGQVFAKLIVPRQHFQQLNLKAQIAVGLDMRAHRPLAIGQVRRHKQPAHPADLHAHQPLVPALDHPPGADHTLERLAPLPGRIEDRTVFQGAGVLGGDQCALDHGFAGAWADVGDLEFVGAHGVLVEGVKAGVFPESVGFGKCRNSRSRDISL